MVVLCWSNVGSDDWNKIPLRRKIEGKYFDSADSIDGKLICTVMPVEIVLVCLASQVGK